MSAGHENGSNVMSGGCVTFIHHDFQRKSRIDADASLSLQELFLGGPLDKCEVSSEFQNGVQTQRAEQA